MVYLTPTAISSLTQVILAALISGYFVWRARRGAVRPHTAWLAAFFVSFTLFLTALFFEAALTPTPRMRAVPVQNAPLAVAVACLLQFAYHFPARAPALRREARLALALGALYALWETGYVVFRFVRLGAGVVEYRPNWSDYVLLLFFLWVPVALLRSTYHHTPPGSGRWRRFVASLRRPPSREIHAARTFGLILLVGAGLNLFNILRAAYLVPVDLANAAISLGTLGVLFAFATAYLNYQPETTSFMVKLAGGTLTAVLAIMATTAWAVSPQYEALFQLNLPQGQALRLAPNDRGGYDLSQIPFAWENDVGRDLHLDDGLQRGCSEPLSFPFLFFGQWQEEVYACNDGVISVGQITRYREYQYRYGGGAPLIMPLLMDLDPTISEGGIFVRQDAGRLVVTWDRLRGFRRPEAELTFQAVLYPDGVLEFAYQDLPGDIRFRPNDDPGAGPWAIGVVSGGLRGDGPQEIDLAPLPLQGGPAGMVHDYVRAFRQHLHRLLAPLAWLILLASALVVTGFPLLFYVSLVRPLNSLLAGVREVNAGNLELSMPIQAQDEIGFLTQAFNSMIAALRTSINSLEDEVRRRTRQLEEQNAELAQARTLAEERRRIAEVERQTAEAANEAKSIFLANMSHELRTPLTAVLGYSELMAHDRNLTSEQRQNLARIGRSGEHLLALINNVLQLSRIEAGRLELEPEEMDLHLLLAGLEEMFYLRAQQKGLQLRSEIGAGVPRLVRADQGKLRQVLINLLGNAVKFTSEGQITLRVRHLAAISGDGAAGPGASRRLRFEVEDTGIGIKPEERNIIFEPFIQTARGRGAAPGTGLGLSISRQFVELMGGALTVHSAGIPGQGSLFAFDLPVDIVEAQDTLPARVRRRAVALEAGQPAYRLLVVDDVTASRVLLVKLLQPLGFEIREAANGQEALAAWEEWRPHLIWMDRRMPGMDGDEAMRRIKATAGGEETIVIALTASAFEEERAATLARGYDDFLRKPARSGEILDILAKHLGARFVYEKLPPEAPAAAEGTAETLNVADLPPEWRAALRKAVTEADVGRIAALAQEIQDLAPATALALDQALADFDYDLILGALERCGDNEQTIREEQG